MTKVFRFTGLFMPPGGAKPEPPEPPLVKGEFKLLSHAIATAETSNMYQNGATVTIDTTGADLIIVSATFEVYEGQAYNIEEFGVSGANTWQVLEFGSGGGTRQRLWYTRPTLTSATHRFQLFVIDSYPVIAAMALQGWNGVPPNNFQHTIVNLTSNTTLQVQPPLTTDAGNFIISTLGMWRANIATSPEGYSVMIDQVVGGLGGSYSQGVAWKLKTEEVESPAWGLTWVTQGNVTLLNNVIFEPEMVEPTYPTMEFAVEPSDTEVGELFDPEIVVTISNQSEDSLTISSYSGTCAITPLTVKASPTGAVFTGLRAGVEGQGCRLRVHNNTNPNVTDIVSQVFNVTPPLPIPEWELITRSFNTWSNNVICSATIDSTGANLIVVQTVTLRIDLHGGPGAFALWDNLGNSFDAYTLFIPATDENWYLRAYASINPIVGPGHQITFGLVGTLFNWPYPGMHIMAFNAPNPQLAIEGPTYGNTNPTWSASVGPLTPANISFPGALCVTGVATDVPPVVTTPPLNYDMQSGNSYVLAAHRVRPDPGIENTIWTSTASLGSMNLIVFKSQP